MLVGFFVLIWVIWTVCVTVYYCFNYFWTAFRYAFGVMVVVMCGSPKMLAGLEAGANGYEMAATVIWLHLGGSILAPHIFFFTVLPVLILLAAKK